MEEEKPSGVRNESLVEESESQEVMIIEEDGELATEMTEVVKKEDVKTELFSDIEKTNLSIEEVNMLHSIFQNFKKRKVFKNDSSSKDEEESENTRKGSEREDDMSFAKAAEIKQVICEEIITIDSEDSCTMEEMVEEAEVEFHTQTLNVIEKSDLHQTSLNDNCHKEIVKRKNSWVSDVIPKKKTRNEIEKKEDEEEFELSDYVEHDKTYFFGHSTKIYCKLCSFKGKLIVQHYRMKHPESEVLISRINPDMVKILIEDAMRNHEEYDKDHPELEQMMWNFKCPFCLVLIKDTVNTYYNHISSHTGEYCYHCNHCSYWTYNHSNICTHLNKMHSKIQKTEYKMVFPDPKISKYVFGHICSECNFTQLIRATVEEHAMVYHPGSPEIHKVNLGLLLEDEMAKTSSSDQFESMIQSMMTQNEEVDPLEQPEEPKELVEVMKPSNIYLSSSTPNVLEIGPISVIKESNVFTFHCKIQHCNYYSEDKNAFATHCEITHKDFIYIFGMGKCNVCSFKFDYEGEFVTVHDIYLHIVTVHKDFFEQKSDINFRLPHDIPNVLSQTYDNPGSEFPFIISNVTSLACGSDTNSKRRRSGEKQLIRIDPVIISDQLLAPEVVRQPDLDIKQDSESDRTEMLQWIDENVNVRNSTSEKVKEGELMKNWDIKELVPPYNCEDDGFPSCPFKSLYFDEYLNHVETIHQVRELQREVVMEKWLVKEVGPFQCRYCKKATITHQEMKRHQAEFHAQEQCLFYYRKFVPNETVTIPEQVNLEDPSFINHVICLPDQVHLWNFKLTENQFSSTSAELTDKASEEIFILPDNNEVDLLDEPDLVYLSDEPLKNVSATNNKMLEVNLTDECEWKRCHQKYNSQAVLIKHIEKDHVYSQTGKEFSCLWNNCSRESKPFFIKRNLLFHMRLHSGEKPYRCAFQDCNQAFSRVRTLKIHQRRHTGEKPYLCKFPNCGKRFSSGSCQIVHQRTHFVKKPYDCQASGWSKKNTEQVQVEQKSVEKSQKDGDFLLNDQQMHNNTELHNCHCLVTGCSQKYTTSRSLWAHMMEHTIEEQFEAEQKLMEYTQSKSRLVQEEPSESFEILQCKWEDCYQTQNSQAALRRHLKENHVYIQSGQEFFCLWINCPRELKPFSRKDTLLIHMGIHCEEKPYKCLFEGCSAAFSQLRTLKLHRKRHAGERPYMCHFINCFESFWTRIEMIEHQKTHCENGIYACQVTNCSRSYSHRRTLWKHMKSHTRDELLEAKRKSIEKKQKGDDFVPNNQETHSDTELYPCHCQVTGCSKKYTTSASLKRHMKLHTVEEQLEAEQNLIESTQKENHFVQEEPTSNFITTIPEQVNLEDPLFINQVQPWDSKLRSYLFFSTPAKLKDRDSKKLPQPLEGNPVIDLDQPKGPLDELENFSLPVKNEVDLLSEPDLVCLDDEDVSAANNSELTDADEALQLTERASKVLSPLLPQPPERDPVIDLDQPNMLPDESEVFSSPMKNEVDLLSEPDLVCLDDEPPQDISATNNSKLTDTVETLQFQCKWKDCYRTCDSQTTFVKHVEENHIKSLKDKEFSCLWLDCLRKLKPYDRSYELLKHMRVHTGEKPYKCPFQDCHRAFSLISNLKRHEKSHTGERPYSTYACLFPNCLKRYGAQNNLVKHMETHTVEEQLEAKEEKSVEEKQEESDFVLNNQETYHDSTIPEQVNLEDPLFINQILHVPNQVEPWDSKLRKYLLSSTPVELPDRDSEVLSKMLPDSSEILNLPVNNEVDMLSEPDLVCLDDELLIDVSAANDSMLAVEPTDTDDPLECKWNDCYQVYDSQVTFIEHIEKDHIKPLKGEEFTCSWIGCRRKLKPFHKKWYLSIHMRGHSGEKPYKCRFHDCRRAFALMSNLRRHEKSHTGEKRYVCQFPNCSKTFAISTSRISHERTHYDSGTYACKITNCSKKYTTQTNLIRHVKTHTIEEQLEAKKQKSVEEKQEESDFVLNNQRTHYDSRPYTCHCLVTGCSQKFTSSKSLLTHMKDHTVDEQLEAQRLRLIENSMQKRKWIEDTQKQGHLVQEEPSNSLTMLQCEWDDCYQIYNSQIALVKHIWSHVYLQSGNEFTCFWINCPRRSKPFKLRQNLLMHMRIHSGERPHRCLFQDCNKAFSRADNLEIHQRSHTGEKPYTCQFPNCFKSFIDRSSRHRHQRKHFNNTQHYECYVHSCSQTFRNPGVLWKHLKKNHTVDEQLEHNRNKRKQHESEKNKQKEDNFIVYEI